MFVINSLFGLSSSSMVGVRLQRRAFALCVIAICFFMVLYALRTSNLSSLFDGSTQVGFAERDSGHGTGGQLVKPYRFQQGVKHLWFVKNCLKTITRALGIEKFGTLLNIWKNVDNDVCRNLYHQFSEIYQVQTRTSELVIPATFMQKLMKWLKNNTVLIEEAKAQKIISFSNQYTQESTVFNPLRGKRPGAGEGASPEERQYVDEVVEKAGHDCDFCNYMKMTARDPFEVPENENCVIVSNTFKLEKFHSLVLWKRHHPLKFDEKQILDAMEIAQRWFQKAHEHDSNFNAPHIYWDVLPKASASQIHPHLHVTVASNQYYAKWNRLHAASIQFAAKHNGANYFSTLLKIHDVLGLALHFGKASVMAYMTPQASFEVLLISKEPGDDIFKLLYHTMRVFVEDLHLYALSTGMVFPRLTADPANSDLPMMIRIVYRGLPSGARSDVSSIELFGTPNVNVDPYKVMESLKSSIVERSQ